MTGETYTVGKRYFLVMEGLSLLARVVAVAEAELVCDDVEARGADARWSKDALAKRYFIAPASDRIILRRGAINIAIEVTL